MIRGLWVVGRDGQCGWWGWWRVVGGRWWAVVGEGGLTDLAATHRCNSSAPTDGIR